MSIIWLVTDPVWRLQVYANDLNPCSFHWLKENVRLNKVSSLPLQCNIPKQANSCQLVHGTPQVSDRVQPYCKDGRDFMRFIASMGFHVHHVVMNLPASATKFLDVFPGLFEASTVLADPPQVHCYLFARKSETMAGTVCMLVLCWS